MASIQSLGIGSGLLTTELLESLLEAERAPVENRLNVKQELADARISAYGELRSALSSVEASLQALTLGSTFNANTAVSADDKLLTATASSLAVAGNYSISVAQLAQNHSLASDAYSSVNDVLGTGVLSFRLGTTDYGAQGQYQGFELNAAAKSRTVVINASNNTLSGIRDAVNAADFGVQASIVDDGSGFRLLFSSKESGENQSIELTASGSTGLRALSYNAASQNANLAAQTRTGSLDLSDGAGLDTTSRAFRLSYNFMAMDVVVPADAQITDSASAVAAVQSALDEQLIAAGFAPGAVIAEDDGGGLRFRSAAPGYGHTLEVQADGSDTLDGFGLNTSEGVVSGVQRMTQTMSAQDAQFSVNGISVTRSNNLAVGVIPGTTLNLKGVTSGPVSLSVTKDPANTVEKIQDFVDSYNQLKVLADGLSAYNPDAGQNGQGSLLTGDSTLRLISNEINRLLRTTVTGLGGGLSSLSAIGITSDQNNKYMLNFNTTTFSEEFVSNPAGVRALFAATGSASDPRIDYVGVGASTQPGNYAVDITRLATTGSYEGGVVAALAAGNLLIDENNRKFTIELDGVPAQITLNTGMYSTAADLAEQIQMQINSDPGFIRTASSVEVRYDETASRFDIRSTTYGSQSNVRFLEADPAVADTLGLIIEGRGDFRGNQMLSLATPSGSSAENFAQPLEISSPTSFRLSINGSNTAMITLPGDALNPQLHQSPDELLAAIQAQIDADPLFANPQVPAVTVSYSFDADSGLGRLNFSSGSQADRLRVSETTAGAAALGLYVGSGGASRSTAGVDVAGTINGIEAIGRGQSLIGASGVKPATSGLYLHGPHGDLSQSSAADSFRVSVDGVESGDISLGTLSNTDPVAVAAGMQVAINNSPALMAAGVGVTVQYNAEAGGFAIISNSTGAASTVRVVGMQGNAAAILGFAAGAGNLGSSGREASGEVDPASGLRLSITGGEVGSRGSVTFTKGIADQLKSLLSSYLGNDGLLSTRTTALGKELETIAQKRVELDERVARSETRLRASFLANDLIISRLNTTADFLTSQLEMLEQLASGASRKKK